MRNGTAFDGGVLYYELSAGYVLPVPLHASSSSLGSLFTHWIADSLTLWKSPVTDEHLWTAALYYSSLAKATPLILYFLSAVVAIGAVTILWSFGDGQAGNLMFDGGSICAFSLCHRDTSELASSFIWHHRRALLLLRHP